MKLLSLRVEHFRCIEKAKIDFASGLNLLYGPNDLGKSSLALAIRAVLLLQSTAKEHEEFVSWHGTGEPLVELVFESEPQRIWRLRKTFGSASSYLEWSKDGVDFATEARGRDVDGKISEILKWGVAPPGGKGRPKGMPTSFLATVLLPEQDGVGAIFDQALDHDSDESGKRQLITALQAMAEDPLFKSVLARVQERVDEAFNSSGGKKRGKNSPWVKWSEEIQRKQEYSEKCLQELQRTAGIESEIQDLLGRQLILKEAVDRAEESIERLEQDFEKERRRQEILTRREECETRVAAIANELRELAEAERVQVEHGQRIDGLSKLRENAKVAQNQAARKTEQAKEEFARLESEDRVRERQLQQSTLETRLAGLRTEELLQQTSVESIRRVEAADAKVRKLEGELRALVQAAKDAQKKRESSRKEREDLEQQERELCGIRWVLRRQTAQAKIQQAEEGLAQVRRWRSDAAEKLGAAAVLEAAQPRFPLPSHEQLNRFRRLDSDRRVAAARLEVGLSVTLRPKRPMRISVKSDGAGAMTHDLTTSTFEVGASRQVQLEIADVAEIAISGGAADARQEAERLERLWAAEAGPALEAAGAATLEDLGRIVSEAAGRATEIQAARQEAAQLEQRATDQVDWARSLAEGQKELAAVDFELADADRSKLDKASARLGIKTAAEIDKRIAALRESLERIAKDEKLQDSEVSAANTRTVEKQKVLDEATGELESVRAAIPGDWQDALKQVLGRQSEVQKELDEVERDLARLATADDEKIVAARETLTRCQEELAESEIASDAAGKNLNEAVLLYATNSGALQTRRESVAKLDEKGAREALQQVDAELQSASRAEQAVNDAVLAEARNKLDEAASYLKEIDGKIREKRGALQQVGGEVARQRAEDAGNELQSAKERAQEVELEFNAWELLRKTLREAEQEEGTHLGHALAGPIAKRFAALTADRYGRLALGPNLETQGISVAGEDRLVRLLSVGTRDQLSTLFRLTLAEELKTAVILDDQLTQTDSRRMAWLRDLLKEVSRNIQVIVFTCRPDDYLAPTGTRRKTTPDDKQPPVRSVDLSQFIERWGTAGAP
jgi:DNA repair exonuclease SbcCD ATPase subunit